jgi:hypothetical protein
MKIKSAVFVIPALCCAFMYPGLCAGAARKVALTVQEILFRGVTGGSEQVSVVCNQPCIPEVFSLEGEDLRVVMDIKGLSDSRVRVIDRATGGSLVKRIRSYFDKKTKVQRVVLDMAPSKLYAVHPQASNGGNTYVLMIAERGGTGAEQTVSPEQEKRIAIHYPGRKDRETELILHGAGDKGEQGKDAGYTGDIAALVDKGKKQFHAGDFRGAVDTFTQAIADQPQESMGYRLRGNAYDNLGDRQKAVEDWIRAARLGDTVIQSYLDFLTVAWQENPAP